MELKKGFTLIELMVVIGIIGVLLTVGMNLFFQVVMSANKATTEADLRQNASLVMETISREVRKAGCISAPNNKTLYLYSTNCTGSPFITFMIASTYITSGLTTISSPNVAFTNSTFLTDGKTVTVNLIVNGTGTRSDFQGTITETQTISVRNGVY